MEEKKRFFIVSPAITYNKNKSLDYKIYNSIVNENDRHQFKFSLYFESLEEYFLGLNYLTEKGWFNKIIFDYSIVPMGINPKYRSWFDVRKRRICRNHINSSSIRDEFDFDARIEIGLVVDWNRLEEFRDLLKSFPGYKTQWMDENNINEFIIK